MITNDVGSLRGRGRELWAEACKFDGIPADSSFVTFSAENPFRVKLDEVTRLLLFVKRCEAGLVEPVLLP